MTTLIDIVIPVFGLVVIGYAAAKLHIMDDAATRGLSRFVFNFAIPALLFGTMATTTLPETLEWGLLLSYYIGVIVIYAMGMIVTRVGFGRTLDQQSLLGFGAAFSNTVLLGIPVVLTAFGPAATLPLFLLIAFHGASMFTVVTVLVEVARGRGGRLSALPGTIVKSVAGNPIVAGLAVGLAVNLLDLPVPRPIEAVADALGSAALPCATFAMGAALARYRIAGSVPEATILVVLKTVVHPSLVWLLATQVFDVTALWAAVAAVLAAQPTGVNAYLFAQRYDACVATTATAILMSTALSVLTVSAWLWFLDVR